MRYAICYVSSAATPVNLEDISDVLKQAKEKNIKNDVKGILLYSEGNFFQVLEGDKNYILELYTLIENDPRHHTLIQVLGKGIDQGSFDGYVTDIITEKNKYDPDILEEYLEGIKGIEPKTKEVVESILEVFIETRK